MRPRTPLASQRLQSSRLTYICSSCQRKQLHRSFSHNNRQYEEAPAAATLDISNDASSENKPRPKTRRPKRVFLSMIQPTGIPHLGNYLGALRDWKSYQDEKTHPDPARRANHRLFFAISDLHSLTGKQDRTARREAINKTFASLLAIGLSPEHSVLFIQSRISYHAELMWILSTVASMGYLSRMTQWKSKSGLTDAANLESLDQKAREKLKLGLFSYPVLQAADILLYGPDFVPVGEDQIQHIEFTRSLARSFNKQYATDYPTADRPDPPLRIPGHILSPAKRIMSLTQPTQKMSKSATDADKSNILITDTPDEIRAKLKAAVTDSVTGPITYNPAERPGVSNLLEILKHSSRSPLSCEELAAEHANLSLGALKTLVADVVTKDLEGVREKYFEVMDPKSDAIQDALSRGYRIATAKAGNTMKKVREAVGL